MRLLTSVNAAAFVSADPAHRGLSRPYSNERERLLHRAAISALAEQLARPVHEVEPVYEDVLEQMKPQARVNDYLSIFVAKRVRRLLQN